MIFTLTMGLTQIPFNQEIIFTGSMAIVLLLMARLLQELSQPARRTLVQTAIIIFVFRALPTPGAGSTWWQIDELGFDQQFLSTLSLISGGLALLGMFIFRRFMAEKSIVYVVGFLPRHVLWLASVDPVHDGRDRRCTLHSHCGYGTGVAPRPGGNDPHACMDCQQPPHTLKGDILCGHGLLH